MTSMSSGLEAVSLSCSTSVSLPGETPSSFACSTWSWPTVRAATTTSFSLSRVTEIAVSRTFSARRRASPSSREEAAITMPPGSSPSKYPSSVIWRTVMTIASSMLRLLSVPTSARISSPSPFTASTESTRPRRLSVYCSEGFTSRLTMEYGAAYVKMPAPTMRNTAAAAAASTAIWRRIDRTPLRTSIVCPTA